MYFGGALGLQCCCPASDLEPDLDVSVSVSVSVSDREKLWKDKTTEKPPELDSEALSPWTEYETEDGTKYYHNAETGETRWSISSWIEYEKLTAANPAAQVAPPSMVMVDAPFATEKILNVNGVVGPVSNPIPMDMTRCPNPNTSNGAT